MWPAWINIMLGIWVFTSGFWYVVSWNFFTSGFFIAFFGFLHSGRQWQGIMNGILGGCLIASSFSPVLRNAWNLWITGILVTALAVWRTKAASREMTDESE